MRVWLVTVHLRNIRAMSRGVLKSKAMLENARYVSRLIAQHHLLERILTGVTTRLQILSN